MSLFETQLINQTFYGSCHSLQASSQNSISDCPWSFPIYYLFAPQVLSVRNFNLMQVPLVPRLKRLVSHICHAVWITHESNLQELRGSLHHFCLCSIFNEWKGTWTNCLRFHCEKCSKRVKICFIMNFLLFLGGKILLSRKH